MRARPRIAGHMMRKARPAVIARAVASSITPPDEPILCRLVSRRSVRLQGLREAAFHFCSLPRKSTPRQRQVVQAHFRQRRAAGGPASWACLLPDLHLRLNTMDFWFLVFGVLCRHIASNSIERRIQWIRLFSHFLFGFVLTLFVFQAPNYMDRFVLTLFIF